MLAALAQVNTAPSASTLCDRSVKLKVAVDARAVVTAKMGPESFIARGLIVLERNYLEVACSLAALARNLMVLRCSVDHEVRALGGQASAAVHGWAVVHTVIAAAPAIFNSPATATV